VTCPVCGATNPADALQCRDCGIALAKASPAERVDALLEDLPIDVRNQALDASTRFRSLRSSGGGARAAVTTADGSVLDCWVGVVHGALAAHCECRADRHQPLCAHAVVVTRAAPLCDPYTASQMGSFRHPRSDPLLPE